MSWTTRPSARSVVRPKSGSSKLPASRVAAVAAAPSFALPIFATAFR
jgi:hypothetical protein